MKYVWIVVNKETTETVALYDDASIAEKLAPVIAKKLKIDTLVERRTINMEMSQVGIRK